MIKLNHILCLIGVLIVLTSCKPEKIEPNGFYAVNFTTNPNQNQIFNYYLDDGELVAGGLDEYVVRIKSEPGTFESESDLFIKHTSDISQLPDTLIPFTYFMGLQYKNSINKDLEIAFNLNYLYNNFAHTNYSEYIFLKENIQDLKLYKINFEENAELYYDADMSFEIIDAQLTENEVTFKTKDKNALFGLCWEERSWTDTVLFNKVGLTQQNVYADNRAKSLGETGAYVENNVLNLHYDNQTLIDSVKSTQSGIHFYKINMLINNPHEGLIDHKDVYLDLMVEEATSSNYTNKSYLKLKDNTEINIVKWPNFGEIGTINISGPLKSEISQSNVVIDMTINFFRQR